MASIKLTKFMSEALEGQPANQQVWPISIKAEGVDMPSAIFVYHVAVPGSAFEGDIFECVASPNQLHELPANQAAPISEGYQVPFYRRDICEFYARSASEAARIWEIIQEEVATLVRDVNASNTLTAVEVASVTEEEVVQESQSMNPPIRHFLSYHPCGTAGLVGPVQTIESPFTPDKDGWLPPSQVAFTPPPGAILAYNIDQDPVLKALLPLKEPWSGHQLTRNGILLQFGLHYTITKDTIWWLEFNPATIAAYTRLTGQVQDANMPWPTDYLNRNNPGDTTPNFTLQIFQ